MTAINEATGNAQNMIVNASGRLLVEIAPRHLDLGCVISAAAGQPGYQVPVNSVVNASVSHTGLGWVRNILFGLQSSGTFDVGFQRLIGGFGNYFGAAAGMAGQASPMIASKALALDDLGGKSIIGDSCRFYIKNVGSSATDASLYVQLMA